MALEGTPSKDACYWLRMGRAGSTQPLLMGSGAEEQRCTISTALLRQGCTGARVHGCTGARALATASPRRKSSWPAWWVQWSSLPPQNLLPVGSHNSISLNSIFKIVRFLQTWEVISRYCLIKRKCGWKIRNDASGKVVYPKNESKPLRMGVMLRLWKPTCHFPMACVE